MNKTFLKSVLAVTALLFGSAALAQSVGTTANNPIVATGGTVVSKDQTVTLPTGVGANGDTVVMRLPAGANFSGTPTATGTGNGLQLRINGSGDPGDNGLVTLTDTNSDGGMDRAEVTLAAGPSGGSGTVTWKGSVTYSGSADTGTLMASHDVFDTSASAFLMANAAADVADLVKAAAAPSPIAIQNSTAVTVQNVDFAYRAFSSAATYVIELPSGVGSAATNNTVTVTLGTGIQLDTSTAVSALTSHTDGAPAVAVGAIADDGTSFDLTIGAATTRASQYSFTVSGYETVGQSTPTAVNLSLSGDAGLSGSVLGANLAATGSTVALTTVDTEVDLIRDADAAQTLPSFGITEVFPTDFADGETITLVAPTGMLFQTAGTTASNDGTAVIAANSVNTAKTEITITITTAGSGATAETLTTTGVTVTATSSAAATLAVTAGKSITGESPNAPFTSVTVANAANRGAVTIAGPTTAGKVGAGTSGNTGVISIYEETYGAINTNSTFPFIQVSPPAGITITGIVPANTGATSFAFGAVAPAVPADGSFVINVTSESDSKVLMTAPLTLTITYDVASTAGPGTAVEFTIGGDVGVSGTATTDNVVNTTVSSVPTGGVVPDEESSIDFVAAATLQVKEEFADALDVTANQFFRVIAPSGITFASSQPTPAGIVNAVTVDTTFSANDTLLVDITATAGSDTVTVTPNVFVSSSAAAGFNTFSVTDGDTNDSNGANVTSGTVDLIYVGDVADPDAGADITVVAGFPVSQDVTGGLSALTSSSADDSVATVSNTDTSVTVTGVSVGATVVTVTDALGVTDTVAVTVTAGAAQPTRTTESTAGATDAAITGGISADGGLTFATDGAVNVGDSIQIVAEISVATDDVGDPGELIVALVDANSGTIWTVSSEGALVDFATDGLSSFRSATALAATETINVTGGALTLDASTEGLDLDIFVGYTVDGFVNVVYNSDPIDLTISAAP